MSPHPNISHAKFKFIPLLGILGCTIASARFPLGWKIYEEKNMPQVYPIPINLKTGPNMELTGCKLKLKPDCCHFANLPLGSTDNSSRTEKYLKNTIFLLGFKVVPLIRSLFLQVHIGLGGISTDFRLEWSPWRGFGGVLLLGMGVEGVLDNFLTFWLF